MKVKRRTQAERSGATQAALIAAGRELFAAHGYDSVGTTALARSAGVTRGALYHQFGNKPALFSAVAEAVEADLTRRLGEAVVAAGHPDALSALHGAVEAWLDACEEPEIRQVLLLDAPRVLGWEAVRKLTSQYGLALTEQLLQAAMDAGQLPSLPARPFAHVLLGALQESAFVIAADTRERAEVATVLHTIIGSLKAMDEAPGRRVPDN